MAKIVITGGAGYVGSALVLQLLNLGHRVRVFDNLMYGGNHLLGFFENNNFEFQKGDIRNAVQVKKALEGQDFIIHLAAIVGYPACKKDPDLAEQVNVGGTKNIISASLPEQKIIFASTGSNYGAVNDICTEETPLRPLSLYGKTKTEAEELLLKRNNTVIYRFATAFGVSPRLRLDLLINDFTYKAFTKGHLTVYEKNFKRTFINVSDMARAIIFAQDNFEKMKNQVFNVGSESLNYSKEGICEIIKKKTNCQVEYAEVGTDEDKRDYEVSYKKINDEGFFTKVSLDEGIDALLRAFLVLDDRGHYLNV